MTVRRTRAYTIDTTPSDLWDLLVDPAIRAEALPFVTDYTVHDADGRRATWILDTPLPLGELSVKTKDTVRDPPTALKFTARCPDFNAFTEHTLTETPEHTRIDNQIVIRGQAPGVERLVEARIDDELDKLKSVFASHI